MDAPPNYTYCRINLCDDTITQVDNEIMIEELSPVLQVIESHIPQVAKCPRCNKKLVLVPLCSQVTKRPITILAECWASWSNQCSYRMLRSKPPPTIPGKINTAGTVLHSHQMFKVRRKALLYSLQMYMQKKVKIHTQKNSDESVMQFFVWFYFQVFVLLQWFWVGLSNEETKKTMILIYSFLIPDMSASAPWFFCSMRCEASDVTETTWPDYMKRLVLTFGTFDYWSNYPQSNSRDDPWLIPASCSNSFDPYFI